MDSVESRCRRCTLNFHVSLSLSLEKNKKTFSGHDDRSYFEVSHTVLLESLSLSLSLSLYICLLGCLCRGVSVLHRSFIVHRQTYNENCEKERDFCTFTSLSLSLEQTNKQNDTTACSSYHIRRS